MILIDDVYDDKEEISEVTTILPPSYPESRVHDELSRPLLPVARAYGTFDSNPKRRPTRRKVLKAFLAVWVLVFCLFMVYLFFLRDSTKQRSVSDEDGKPPRTKKPVVTLPIDDARIQKPSCVYASPISSDPRASEAIIFMNDDRPNKAAANFSIPVTSDLVHVFNNGSATRAFGFIHFSVSEERRSDVQVDVTISYNTEDQLGTAKICLVEDKTGEMGVGIMFPTSDLTREDEKQVRFDFDVKFPAPLDDSESELILKRLETNFTVVHHRLDDLLKKVKFESVSLRTTYMPISIAGIFTEEIKVRSRDSLLVGTIQATKSVDLQTSNSPINIGITMTNNDTQRPSEVTLKTSNSPIDTALLLYSNNSDSTFLVDAETENAHLNVYNYALPSHSTLSMKARTSRAPVTILAPPQFEGSFQFSSIQSPPFIEPRHVEDPEARGRERRIYVSPNLGADRTVYGKVWWNEGEGELSESQTRLNSSIVVETTVNPIFFKLYHVEEFL